MLRFLPCNQKRKKRKTFPSAMTAEALVRNSKTLQVPQVKHP